MPKRKITTEFKRTSIIKTSMKNTCRSPAFTRVLCDAVQHVRDITYMGSIFANYHILKLISRNSAHPSILFAFFFMIYSPYWLAKAARRSNKFWTHIMTFKAKLEILTQTCSSRKDTQHWSRTVPSNTKRFQEALWSQTSKEKPFNICSSSFLTHKTRHTFATPPLLTAKPSPSSCTSRQRENTQAQIGQLLLNEQMLERHLWKTWSTHLTWALAQSQRWRWMPILIYTYIGYTVCSRE